MRIGTYFDMRNPPGWRRPWGTFYGETLELIEQAEAWGIDAVWVSEHHFFEDGYLPQPLTFASAIAARTKRVRLGTAVLLPALRPSLQIAEEATVVDIISNGRLDLGLGAGYRIPEYEAFGAGREPPVLAHRPARPARSGPGCEGAHRAPARPGPLPDLDGLPGPAGRPARRPPRRGPAVVSLGPSSSPTGKGWSRAGTTRRAPA